MIKLQIVFLVSTILVQSYAQTVVFEKTYDFGPLELEAGFNIIPEQDGYVVCGGTTSQVFGGWSAVKVFKIDSSGNLLWDKVTGKRGYQVFAGSQGSFRKTNDGGYILGGSIEDTATFISDFFLMKFDFFGDTVFTSRFGGINEDIGYSSDQSKDGGYVIFGQAKSFGDIEGDYHLVKTDSNGNFLWEETYGGPRLDRGIDIQATDDGGFLLGGGRIQSNTFQGYIIRTDSVGNVKWDRTYGNNYETCGTYLALTKEGGFIFTSCTDSILSGGYHTYFVAKADSAGNILWEKYYPHSDFHDILMVRKVESGGYVFCGRIRDPNLNGKLIGWIMRLDENGNTIWERRYAHVRDLWGIELITSELWDIQTTQDGGFVATGKTFETQTADFWVLKLDSNGCLGNYCGLTDTNCYYQPYPNCDDTVGISEYSNQESGVRIYPNPASEIIHITLLNTQYLLQSIVIADMSGKQILQTTQTEIPVSHLSKGLYFVRVGFTNGQSAVRKVVIQ